MASFHLTGNELVSLLNGRYNPIQLPCTAFTVPNLNHFIYPTTTQILL